MPNILTFARLGLTIIILLMILYSPRFTDRPWFLDIAFVLFVIAGLTDIVDGIVARRYNASTKFGRMIDPFVDKILVCGAFICFALIAIPKLFSWDRTTLAVIHWSVTGVLIVREVYVTILRQWAEAHGINFAAVRSGKIKMFLQSFAIGTVLVKTAHVREAAWGNWFTIIIFAAMIVMTIYSGLQATRRSKAPQAVHV